MNNKINKLLTPQQRLIYPFLVETSLLDKQIADELHLNRRTLKFHNSSIYKRLGVSTRLQLVIKHYKHLQINSGLSA